MEGAIAEQPFKSFQDLKRFKKKSQENRAFIDELCRGITVNTSYSSNIQVRYTGPHPKCRHVFMEFIVIRIKKILFLKCSCVHKLLVVYLVHILSSLNERRVTNSVLLLE